LTKKTSKITLRGSQNPKFTRAFWTTKIQRKWDIAKTREFEQISSNPTPPKKNTRPELNPKLSPQTVFVLPSPPTFKHLYGPRFLGEISI